MSNDYPVGMECPVHCPKCAEWVELDDMVTPIGGDIDNSCDLICPNCKDNQNPECHNCNQESDYECKSCGCNSCEYCTIGIMRKRCLSCNRFVKKII